MWKYVQATGQMFGPDGREVAKGYAGNGASKNRPEDQCKVNQGPLPRNIYTIERCITHPRLGPAALPLTPHNESVMCGRTAFYIHGDNTTNPGNASDGCIILARNVREQIDASPDKELLVVGRVDAAVIGALGDKGAGGVPIDLGQVVVTLRRLIPPVFLVLAAALLTGLVAGSERPFAQLALFGSWLLCAWAAIFIVKTVRSPLMNEVGRDDAAHLFTISWFVLLVSGMAAGSLWNVFVKEITKDFNAFVSIPASVWILGGITILSNVGVRAAFATSRKPDKYNVQPTNNRVASLMTTPLDDDGSAKMAAAQYVVFNLIALVIYGVAIARLFASVTGKAAVADFPAIPAEVLGLMAVSGAGLVASSAIPILRK